MNLGGRFSLCALSSLSKPAVRLLGIAESTPANSERTLIAGVVMRADFILDGMIWGRATIGGMDGTDAIISLFHQIDRDDLGGVILHGCVIAGYNVINLQQLHIVTNLPIISVTREPQEDMKEHLTTSFPDDWQKRWEIILHNGLMKSLNLPTGSTVFVQAKGIDPVSAHTLVKRLTRFGGVPEPIRVARVFARALAKRQNSK